MNVTIRVALFVVASLCIGSVGDATAQPNCGAITKGVQAVQVGNLKVVQYVSHTQREIIICEFIDLQAEGWVTSVSGSAGVQRSGAYYVEVNKTVPTLSYGTFNVNGKHWMIFNLQWFFFGTSLQHVTLTPPSPPKPPHLECEDNGGFWDETGQWCDDNTSPILLDVDGNGYALTSVEDGVLFDIDGDGALEQVAWPRVRQNGTVDAWLAYDRNGNGTIDNGTELWGNVTPASSTGLEPTAANGFEALKFTATPSYGFPSAVEDHVIDGDDGIWPYLLLWRDTNHNGISEPGELQPVSSSALVGISTDYKLSKRRDVHGNEFRLKSRAKWSMGGTTVSRPIWDVWLRTTQ